MRWSEPVNAAGSSGTLSSSVFISSLSAAFAWDGSPPKPKSPKQANRKRTTWIVHRVMRVFREALECATSGAVDCSEGKVFPQPENGGTQVVGLQKSTGLTATWGAESGASAKFVDLPAIAFRGPAHGRRRE